MEINSHAYPDLYKNLDIDIKKLGCIMLDLAEPLPIRRYVPDVEADLYYAKDPELKWVRGDVGSETAHVTLLYGLLQPGRTWKREVDTVLSGWTPPAITFDKLTVFPSYYEDEPYYCLVAEVVRTEKLVEGNHRLRLLPHVDTFPEYRPHVTLAYLKKSPMILQKWDKYLNLSPLLHGEHYPVQKQVNYGGFK